MQTDSQTATSTDELQRETGPAGHDAPPGAADGPAGCLVTLEREERTWARAEQTRAFDHAVRDGRRPAGWWQRWLRRLPGRRAGGSPGTGARSREHAAERADEAREAQLAHQLFAVGLHHLR